MNPADRLTAPQLRAAAGSQARRASVSLYAADAALVDALFAALPYADLRGNMTGLVRRLVIAEAARLGISDPAAAPAVQEGGAA